MADVPGQESPSEEKPKGRSTGWRMMNWLGYGLEEEQDKSASAPAIEDAGAAINGDVGAQAEPVTEVHSLPLAEETPADSDEGVGPPPASEPEPAAQAEPPAPEPEPEPASEPEPAPEPEPPAPEPEAETAAHAAQPD